MEQKTANLDKKEIQVEPNDEILGLYVMKDKEELISNIRFINTKKNSYTRITLKFILMDEAKLDLEATAVIQNGAALTDTYLKIDCLLLSENAKAHVVPCMEIMEDDVKGGHGATIGMVDDLQKWYLTSRGISSKQAERLLIEGFAQDLIDKANSKELKDDFKKQLSRLEL